MSDADPLAVSEAPDHRSPVELDVRNLGPPKPLTETLEATAELADDEVLVQYNDRKPQHLYPKLEDRGLTHDTVETDDATVTVIWRES